MKTKGVKKSPGVKKGNKTPTKGSGGEYEAEDVALEAGVHGLENKQADGGDKVLGLPSSDAGITIDVDLKSELMDDDVNVSAAKGTTEITKDVKLDLESSKIIEAVNDAEAKAEVGTTNEEDAEEDRLQIDNELEDEDKDEDEGDEVEEEDEVEDEDEADDEDGEQDDDVLDANQFNEVDNVAATGNEKYVDRTLSVMHYSKEIIERRKQKRLEVFVAGLSKEATEADIRSVFEKVGEVMDIRLIRNPKSKKVKGYGFVRYADPLEAKQAVEKLNGAEVLGRPCRVSPSEENDILYLGNIGHNWTKEKVLETLGKYGVENVENVNLIGDTHNGECHHGFGFLEFTAHNDAFKAFRRLQRPDAIFGGERSAKVAWAQLLDEPDEAVMLEVKSVFVDGIPSVWDEQKVKELCGKHGEIEEVDLARKKSNPKKKKFGFVKFVTREAAMACIEAINNSEIVEGDLKVKLKARLAIPMAKKKGVKRGICGGFPIGQDTGGQVAGSILRNVGASESKGLVRKRVGQSGANKRKLKKVKTENLAARSSDRRNKDTPFEPRSSQGGRSAFSAHQVSKQSRPERVLPPQRNSRKFKTFSRQTYSAVAEDDIYAHNLGRGGVDNYGVDRYRSNVLGYREARGRTRPYSNLREDLRYGEIPQGDSRVRLAEPEVLSVPYPGTQYARVPYYESSRRVPAGQVPQYAVVQGLASPPSTVVQQAPNYAVYGSSTTPVYASGAYSYAEVGRGGPYISSSFGGHPHSSQGNLHYSLAPTNLSPYY